MKTLRARLGSLMVVLALAVALPVVGAAAGCTSVTLISRYDEQVDQSATALLKQMDAFLAKLQTASGAAAEYEANKDFYSDYAVELRALKVRAESQAKNAPTVQQIELMQRNLEQLEAAHKSGPISPAAIPTFRDLFEQGWRAILTLELAKKRGDA